MTYEAENVPAVMNVWYAGSEGADAIADVVFGKVSRNALVLSPVGTWMPQGRGHRAAPPRRLT